MNLSGGFRIARIRGIDILVHWSWLVIFGLLSWSFAEGLYVEAGPGLSAPVRWAAALLTAALFFGSVLLHELSHAVLAQRAGMAVPSITLFIFGGVSSIAGEMRSPGAEFRVAIAGPLMSWFLGGVCFIVSILTTGLAHQMFGYLAMINAVLGLFNLLPGFPLDGGRVLRSIVWARTDDLERATRVAAAVGQLIAFAMIAGGLVVVFVYGDVGGVWYMLIGLFLRNAALGAYTATLTDRVLRDIAASGVMRAAPVPVDATTTIAALVNTRVLPEAERAFLVVQDGRVVGLVTATDIARVPREEWVTMAVSHIMVPSGRVITVTPRTPILEAMQLMQEHDVHQLPVLDGGQLVGMLTRGDVLNQLEVRLQFSERQ